MQFKLIHKRSNEVVDKLGTRTLDYAKEYFQQKKRLPLETFNKIYEVKTDTRLDTPARPKPLTTPCSKKAMIIEAKTGPRNSPTVASITINTIIMTPRNTASSLPRYLPNHLLRICFIVLTRLQGD